MQLPQLISQSLRPLSWGGCLAQGQKVAGVLVIQQRHFKKAVYDVDGAKVRGIELLRDPHLNKVGCWFQSINQTINQWVNDYEPEESVIWSVCT